MKSLSLLALTAALIATGAAAQGISDREVVRQQDHASAASSATRHPTAAEKRIARSRGSRSFASAPATRLRSERARASNAFDGDWSVLIETRTGACDPAYRYGVQIQNGEILNGGSAPVTLEGHVAPSGVVRVSVAAGGQEAHGAGRLSRTSGSGSWQGQGSAGTCAGTWVAERRE
jgi:hypothetical protein